MEHWGITLASVRPSFFATALKPPKPCSADRSLLRPATGVISQGHLPRAFGHGRLTSTDRVQQAPFASQPSPFLFRSERRGLHSSVGSRRAVQLWSNRTSAV